MSNSLRTIKRNMKRRNGELMGVKKARHKMQKLLSMGFTAKQIENLILRGGLIK